VSTKAVFRQVDGVPMHFHPTTKNPTGRWHGPWEKHPDDSHREENAARPSFKTRPTAEQANLYRRAMRGEKLIDWVAVHKASKARTVARLAAAAAETPEVTYAVAG